MIFTFILVCLAADGVSSALIPISDTDLAGFLTNFRQILLEKIAVETQSTVTQSKALKNRIENACTPKIQRAVAQCKLCAKDKCQSSPSFTDILNLANPLQLLKGPLDTIGSKLNIAKDLLGDKIVPFVNTLKNIGTSIPNEIKNLFNKINDGLESVFKTLRLNEVGNLFGNIGKTIPDTLGDIGKAIPDTLGNIGKAIPDQLGNIGKSIGGFFGGKRRRRSTSDIDPKVRRCMGKCNACKPLLAPTNDAIVAAVCGQDIVDKNATLIAHMLKIQDVYNHVLDKQNDIVKKLKVDFTSMVNFELHNVEISWFVNGRYIKHKATRPIGFLDMATPLALEYWDTFPTDLSSM